ncbi:MAG: Ribonuclease Y [Candidatus Woesebacteria bacterium GW2011_GWA1_39_8]|uniref:Ribonuclease Y n=1 Tax=Candidatus Woesebacteria bacterium GW2011_GWA1_39_8 TaxID=1618552 RepID=A0A0G0S545_9BACT|nr:MAG: Ribonuclease Y [Candidatus Woesebacteria bacterium GW2011_GWA1_39_8]
MSLKLAVLLAGLASLVGIAFGYFLRWIISLGQRGSVELRIKQMELHAREEAKKIVEEASAKAEETAKEKREEFKEREEKIQKTEDRLIKKEEFLDKRQLDIDKEIEQVKEKVSEIKAIKERADTLEKQRFSELQKVSNLTEEEAKEALLKEVERKSEEDIAVKMQKLENASGEKIESRAKEILTSSIQRLANSVSSEVFSTTVAIPSDEIKGKVIGKEGRNIKAFERASGVEVIVDDTPGLITISSYDSVRRQVARVALENLIQDGRIQPAKIEEMVEKAKQEINQITKEKGEQAAYECGVFNLDPRIISILGRLCSTISAKRLTTKLPVLTLKSAAAFCKSSAPMKK